MEKKYFKLDVKKVDQYRGVNIYISNTIPRECVAMMIHGGCIEIHPDAFKILQARPDYLERVYKHEIEAGPGHGSHEPKDPDIISYLKEEGYDFGDSIT